MLNRILNRNTRSQPTSRTPLGFALALLALAASSCQAYEYSLFPGQSLNNSEYLCDEYLAESRWSYSFVSSLPSFLSFAPTDMTAYNYTWPYYHNSYYVTTAVSATSNAVPGTYTFTVQYYLYYAGFANVQVSRSYSVRVLSLTPPTVTSQPKDLTGLYGKPLVLSAGISNATYYQWQHNGTNLSTSTRFSGTTSPSLTISSLTRNDAGLYCLVATNLYGRVVTSNAVLNVNVPQLLSVQAPIPGKAERIMESRYADGVAIGQSELVRFEVQASTNLVNWQSYSIRLTVTNGVLSFSEPSPNPKGCRFFRVVEHP